MTLLKKGKTSRKLKLYIETSTVSHAISDQVPKFKDASLELFKMIKRGMYEAGTSEVVIREINNAQEEKAKQLMDVIKGLDLERLEINEEIEALAEEYIKADLIPVKYIDDALHIATATYYEMDAVVSYNFEHMVKWKTKHGVPSVNVLCGYKAIEIISLMEVN
jgi:predicted nucleic acid-binding protein